MKVQARILTLLAEKYSVIPERACTMDNKNITKSWQ
jgi:hypothetical protein